MGYQLWTSPTTGYRRKGTRLADLRALLGDGITVTAVLEPLQSCPADADAVAISRVLREKLQGHCQADASRVRIVPWLFPIRVT
jgi:hypothetical protein